MRTTIQELQDVFSPGRRCCDQNTMSVVHEIHQYTDLFLCLLILQEHLTVSIGNGINGATPEGVPAKTICPLLHLYNIWRMTKFLVMTKCPKASLYILVKGKMGLLCLRIQHYDQCSKVEVYFLGWCHI